MGTATVAVIGTGGTIGGVAAHRTAYQTYQGGRLNAQDIVAELAPDLAAHAEIRASEFRGFDPPGLKLRDYHELTTRVLALADAVDAVVITTGTQLLEELAYWLDLTLPSDTPVVITGSMRPWTVIGSDAPANLVNAVRLAASGRTTGFGPVVLLNDEIFAARDVTKTSTSRVHAFQSRQCGPLGTVDGDHIHLLRAPARTTPFDITAIDPERLPTVEIAYTYVDAGEATIRGLIDAGATGVVVAGEPSVGQIAAVRHGVERGVVFVAASRNGSGAVYASGMPGVVSAADLLPQKARLLLLLSLAAGGPGGAIGMFEDHAAPVVQVG